MKLIIGLGNPGPKYEKTRHNAGFLVISDFRLRAPDFSDWKINKKFNAEVAEGKIDNEKIILFKPQTFMNESGRAVVAAAAFYKIKPQDILVIHDDIDLPLGVIRIKKDGSSGGHRGVQSIITALDSENFVRLKIGLRPRGPQCPEGVGPKTRPKNFDAAKFVLKKFSAAEIKTLSETIKKATDAVAVILSEGVITAMNRFN